MVDVKEAARKASQYFLGLYDAQDGMVGNVQLEEVELTDDGQYWLITLSYSPTAPLDTILGRSARRYKVFKIDAGTGQVKSMKIRTVD